jgi:hypothetical protein
MLLYDKKPFGKTCWKLPSLWIYFWAQMGLNDILGKHLYPIPTFFTQKSKTLLVQIWGLSEILNIMEIFNQSEFQSHA